MELKVRNPRKIIFPSVVNGCESLIENREYQWIIILYWHAGIKKIYDVLKKIFTAPRTWKIPTKVSVENSGIKNSDNNHKEKGIFSGLAQYKVFFEGMTESRRRGKLFQDTSDWLNATKTGSDMVVQDKNLFQLVVKKASSNKDSLRRENKLGSENISQISYQEYEPQNNVLEISWPSVLRKKI